MTKKKMVYLLIYTMIMIPVIGCEKTGSTDAATVAKTAPDTAQKADVVPQENDEGIDVDLTLLSSTMVYSEVYNMVYYPEDYIGKTVKMSGIYTMLYDETTGKYYHGCIITDATACCAQGIEFEPVKDYVFPDDYPQEGDSICVTGTFDTYKEGENTYCTLRNAKLISAIPTPRP